MVDVLTELKLLDRSEIVWSAHSQQHTHSHSHTQRTTNEQHSVPPSPSSSLNDDPCLFLLVCSCFVWMWWCVRAGDTVNTILSGPACDESSISAIGQQPQHNAAHARVHESSYPSAHPIRFLCCSDAVAHFRSLVCLCVVVVALLSFDILQTKLDLLRDSHPFFLQVIHQLQAHRMEIIIMSVLFAAASKHSAQRW